MAVSAPATQTFARWAGRLLSILAMGFLALTFWRNPEAFSPLLAERGILLASAGLGLVYGLMVAFMALPWRQLMLCFADNPVPAPLVYRSFLTTQIAKYLPGNVLHFAGRHLQLSAAGVGHRPLFNALLWEIATVLGGAVLAICLLLVVAPNPLPVRDEAAPWLGFGGLATVASAVAGLVAAGRRRVLGLDLPGGRTVLVCLAAATLFFIVQGMVFVGVAATLGAPFAPALAAVSVTAWIAGYMTPGAPGGIGIREAVIVTLSASILGEAEALATAALFRLVTTAGDVCCHALGNMLQEPAP